MAVLFFHYQPALVVNAGYLHIELFVKAYIIVLVRNKQIQVVYFGLFGDVEPYFTGIADMDAVLSAYCRDTSPSHKQDRFCWGCDCSIFRSILNVSWISTVKVSGSVFLIESSLISLY